MIMDDPSPPAAYYFEDTYGTHCYSYRIGFNLEEGYFYDGIVKGESAD